MPVDPRHLAAISDLIDSAIVALSDAELAADAAARELFDQGAHPAIVGGAFRVRDGLRTASGMAGVSHGRLRAVRLVYSPVAAALAAAERSTVPTEGERTGGVYIGRERAAQAARRHDQ